MTDGSLPTRERILRSALHLFQQRGYHGTGLSEILDDARAPKGSLYHHFPHGKAELAVAAIEAVAADFEAYFARKRARGVSAANIVRALATAQAQWLKQTGWREGTIFAVLAQSCLPDAPEVQRALAAVHARRRTLLAQALREDGARDADALAELALAALDGAMIHAAAERDARPLRVAAERAGRVLDADCRSERRHV
jgi:TetR/AcrR family transcriptional regulator, lmrAB and yxaGH operons repressor